MKKILGMVVLVFTVFVFVSCNKPNFEEVKPLLREKKYEEVIKIVQPLSKQGHVEAQFVLGTSYLRGYGVKKDIKTGLKWLKESANQDNPKAQHMLGFVYGDGVLQDYETSLEWYRKAAGQGFIKSQKKLADSYYLGKGTPQNYNKAVKWYKKAAKQGSADAQYILGLSYERGEGVLQDYETALEWYKKAAEQDNPLAQAVLGIMYLKNKDYVKAYKWISLTSIQTQNTAHVKLREFLVTKMTSAQLSNAKKMTLSFIQQNKIKNIGKENSKKDDFDVFFENHSIDEFSEIDANYHIELANNGNAEAQAILGEAYLFGQRGVSQDDAEAFKWSKKAAEQGNPLGQAVLGLIYQYGKGVTKDPLKAYKLIRKAAEQGFAAAQVSLGTIYLKNLDMVRAYKWTALAASQDPDPRHIKAREKIKTMMTEDQIVEAQNMVSDFVVRKEK